MLVDILMSNLRRCLQEDVTILKQVLDAVLGKHGG